VTRGWFRRIGTIAASAALAVALCPGGEAAAASPDLRAVGIFGAAEHFTEGETGGVAFGFDGATGFAAVTIDVDLSGLPASFQYLGNPIIPGAGLGNACTWWSAHNGFTCTASGDLGNSSSLPVTAPVGSGGASGTYRVTVHSSEPDANPGNNSAAYAIVVDRIRRTDLALSFTPGAADVGDVAQVRMAVRDNGPDGPPEWIMSVGAPTGTTYLGCEPANCMGGLAIPVGQTVVITLYFRIDSPTIGAGSWSISPDSNRSDPVPGNDVLPQLGSLIHVQAGAGPTGPTLTASPGSGGSGGGPGGTTTGAATGVHGDGGDGVLTVDPVTGQPVPAGSAGATTSVAPGATTSSGRTPTATAAAAPRTPAGEASWAGPTIVSVAVAAAALCLYGFVIARRRRRSGSAPDAQES
jgi:hypothetical protein